MSNVLTDEDDAILVAGDNLKPHAQWAERLVLAAAFMHVAFSASCTGYAIASSGRSSCGRCAWRLSGRLRDVGDESSARFALFALAMIGQTFVELAGELQRMEAS